ncbi:muconolactone Delta-isomerase family protein [Streptomyces sp. V3I8]|uniref:muconolactone Delta-isomerase family protein n=1 Tax=Streptomyces sp. V3I8 TaxID=3042279 RepID=UPI0027D86735|nr:muconolactone Delta-isomerase family protein [Streptomyces sp. V3I8]
MREFLVEIATTVPEGAGQDEVDRRHAAEAVRVRELAASGNWPRPEAGRARELASSRELAASSHLTRLWRPVGELRGIGVRRARDEGEPRGKALGTLPLSPWMTFTVTPLRSHPDGPGRSDDAVA